MTHALGVADGPLQGLHAAQTTADHGCPLTNTQTVSQQRLAMHPVFYRHHREVGTVRLAGRRIEAGWPGGAITAAQIVQANDKELVGINRLAGANTAVPPAGLALINAVITSGMVMPGQRMANQQRVAGAGVELAVGFIHQLVAGQTAPTGER